MRGPLARVKTGGRIRLSASRKPSTCWFQLKNWQRISCPCRLQRPSGDMRTFTTNTSWQPRKAAIWTFLHKGAVKTRSLVVDQGAELEHYMHLCPTCCTFDWWHNGPTDTCLQSALVPLLHCFQFLLRTTLTEHAATCTRSNSSDFGTLMSNKLTLSFSHILSIAILSFQSFQMDYNAAL